MTTLAFVLVPAFAALGLLSSRLRLRATGVLVWAAALLTGIAVAHAVAIAKATHMLGGFVFIDATGRLFLPFVNVIALGISLYVWHRVRSAPSLRRSMGRFVALTLAFLAACNAVLLANHLLAQWIALEMSTLAAAPLILRPGVHATRQASFRYMLFSSVGLGLVLLGLTCLGRGMDEAGFPTSYFIDQLRVAQLPTNRWTHLGVALVILGIGTKLGLVPMYTWLPEVYDEAPPAVAAFLGAVQFNCALVMLLRIVQIYRPHGPELIEGELLTLGLASMVVSTVGVIATSNMKRLIAYAAINHAGVIAIGLGTGKAASYGLLLYVLSNAFIKAILFLTAGKIEAHCGTKDARRISGLIKDLPYSGAFLMVGTFALLGFPPFGSFLGELLILSALVSTERMLTFAAFCLLITMTFVATGKMVFPMIWGEPREKRDFPRQTLLAALPKLTFLTVLVVLGIYIPPTLNSLLQQVAASLEGP